MPRRDAERTLPIIFLHNLKTGGVTLRHIIARQFGPSTVHTARGTPERLQDIAELDELPTLAAHGLAAIQGHMPYGLHRVLRRPASYVSLVRDPVERVISLYHHVLRHPNHKWHRHVRGLSLREFAARDDLPEIENGQTRRLSGEHAPTGGTSRAMLERAILHVERDFAVIGTTERFDETLLLMKRAFGWTTPFYLRANVGKSRPPREAVDPQAIALIEARNGLDRQLHAYVAARLEREISQLGDHFALELQALQTVNRQLEARHRHRRRARATVCTEDVCVEPRHDPRGSALAMLLDAHVALIHRQEKLTDELVALRQQQTRGAARRAPGPFVWHVAEYLARLVRRTRAPRARRALALVRS